MAIQIRKRDRVMITPARRAMSERASPSSSSSSSPSSISSSSSSLDAEDYEKAVAYLRAFRSQNVAVFVDAPPSRSSSSCSPSSNVAPDDISRRRIPLYAILEHDEETADSNCTRLSDEFSTALTLSVNDDDAASYRRRPSSSIPRMKRTRGSACLLDLVDHLGGGEGTLSSRSNVVGVNEPSSPVSSSSFSSRHDDYDHFFDLCLGGDDDVRKMAKHHRGCIAFGRVPAARLHE